ncbi:DNA cytosine methyltransferase [Rhodanobacter panaciterrae]|uniref:DNA cytosine methyltransferase n=1 Tax=Rhodanobacter panaciterrae TaxID=490572 RepID=UPI0016722A73|nr:DNA (cytosine-5-)-methyltransferase [Rhodanobacter panaciterrae]
MGKQQEASAKMACRPKRFVDFFAGLGGFHVGLSALGHECVFASELDEELQQLYENNFGLRPTGDIRLVDVNDVPQHDILCAGFPCQPFSLAGKKKGAACPESGKLIDDVFRVIAHHTPEYVMLENVPNVLTIADGEFWNHITKSFGRLGYELQHRIYSPMQFGFPQQRLRLFVVASRTGLDHFVWPEGQPQPVTPLSRFIRRTTADHRPVEPAKLAVLEHWNRLLERLEVFSHVTLLAPELGATYPLDGLPYRGWRACRGAFGDKLDDAASRVEAQTMLPHYVSDRPDGRPPQWLLPSIEYSRAVYATNPEFYDNWKRDIRGEHNSWQKLEWRSDRSVRDIWQHTLQFRASGIRVMRPELAPSLVAMTPTQTPIIGSQRRYIAVREAAALQALHALPTLPKNTAKAFKALGNAVNARIVHEIALALTAQGGRGNVRSQCGARYGDVQPSAQSRL